MNTVIGWITLKPGTRMGFLADAGTYEEACRAEPGCLFCEFVATSDPDGMLLVVALKDDAAHAEHVGSPHEAAIIARLEEIGVSGRFENIVSDGSRVDLLSFDGTARQQQLPS